MTKNSEKAIVISLHDDLSEIIDLTESLGYKVIKTFIQHREKPDVNSYVGRGKIEEIIEFIQDLEQKINLVIVDGELKPSQWFLLEKKLKVDVYDRLRLILQIFEKHADRKEARLQVKLAFLQYERPFVREIIHRARSGEHPGFMAGGEYQVDDYYEMIKKQMKKIKNELENIRVERKIRRRHRHTVGFYLVSLAGYTNAGKSSLLNLLSDEKVKVEGKLFSTLSTTTRKIKKKDLPILITDTVGFIQNLPAWVIDAFHSTLEEIKVADVVLLVSDVSDDLETIIKKLKVSFNELFDIGVESPILIVLNKTDLITNGEIEKRIEFIKKQDFSEDRAIVVISVKEQRNTEILIDTIIKSLPNFVKSTIKFPIDEKSQSLISWIYDKTHVLEVTYDDFVTISFECNNLVKNQVISKCKEFKGVIIT